MTPRTAPDTNEDLSPNLCFRPLSSSLRQISHPTSHTHTSAPRASRHAVAWTGAGAGAGDGDVTTPPDGLDTRQTTAPSSLQVVSK